MNSLFQSLQPQPSPPQALKSPISKLNNLSQLMQNPQAYIQNAIASNPQARTLVQTLQSSKLSPKQFFYQYAKQNGVDPDQFISSLQ